MVKNCDAARCNSVYQDTRYGPGMRVMNPSCGTKGKQGSSWTCTVCGTKHR